MPPSLPVRSCADQSPLTPEEWQQFFLQGYCVIRNLLNSKEVLDTRYSLLKLMEQARSIANGQVSGFDGVVKDSGANFVLTNDACGQLEQLHRVCGCGSADPVLLHMSRHPKLLGAFADILMSESFEQLICQFHPKLPGDKVTFKPHRDVEFRLHCDPLWQDVNHWGSYVVAVVAIDKATAENGGLSLVPGSHHGVSPSGLKPASEAFNNEWHNQVIQPELQEGDALLMHPYMVHWSGANNSDKPRFSLLSGVSSPGANKGNYPGDCTNEVLSIQP